MPRISLYTLPLMLALLVIFGSSNQAQALTITPIRYEISGDPGQVLQEKMTLTNETKSSQIYFASFANFEAQGDTGSPTFTDSNEDLASWISTEVASINLAPGQQKDVNFTIKIPKDAEPGGHFAALFWGTTPGDKSKQVSIGAKTGLLILLSVNGDVKEQAGLVDFQLHNNKHFYKQLPVGFQYRFSNQGGDRVKPKGDIVIRSFLGWRAKKTNANPNDGNVLPGTTRKFTPEWSKAENIQDYDQRISRNEKYSFVGSVKSEWKNFAFGIFHARTIVQYGTNNEVAKSKGLYFIVLPWELLLVILVIAYPLYKILKMILNAYNKSIIRKAQARTSSGQ